METNQVPHYDDSVNTTGCCPRFNPNGWDGRDLHFSDKPFVRATTLSAMHIPLNMGRVFARVGEHMQEAGALDADNMIVLSRDLGPWNSEHLFSADKDVPGEETTALSGDFVTRVFEGPYRETEKWYGEMKTLAAGKGEPGEVYFFYTTCPKCAKAYGKNYVVGVAEYRPDGART
jgi:hypothetical protein